MSSPQTPFQPREVPSELLAVSSWRGAFDTARTWAAIALVVWACGYLGSWWVWLLGVVLIGGLQNHLMVLLHHSIHVNLHPSRRANDSLARWLVSGPMGQPWSYMRRAHVQHHARLGEADDPDRWYYDVELFGRRRPAMLLFWLVANLLGGLVIPTVRKVFTGQRSKDDPGGSLPGGNALDAVSVLAAQSALFGTFWAISGSWWAWLVLWALPAATLGAGLNCFRTALEHIDAGLPPNRDWSFRSHPIELFFLAPFAMNYHWEHHFLMTVPYYHIADLRRHLEDRGAFPDGVLVGTYVGRLRRILGELRG